VTRELVPLPIDEVLDEIVERLNESGSVVIQAPPGAGKTTRVPSAVLDAGLVEGELLLLEPRRLAARTVARRIASERNVALGQEVGYQVRFDRKASSNTRLMVITEGILTRRLQGDPFLEGVGAVVLDEFHERSIHTDLALAFLKELREVREDLKIIVMSATLGTDEVAAYLDAPVVESEGRTFPLTIENVEKDPETIEKGVTRAVRTLIEDPEDDGGDILVFLPGARDIQNCRAALERSSVSKEVDVCMLYGALPNDQQDRAIEAGPRRKVVLSTNIAETSLTIQHVSAVVDSGLVKELHASKSSGFDELRVEHISIASATQRAGRAGRIRPGRVIRLWPTATEFRMSDYSPAAVARVDVTGAILDVIAWSRDDPAQFDWFESPPLARIERAVELLRDFGAIDSDWNLTKRGERLIDFPLHPRMGVMLDEGRTRSCPVTMARICAILSERDFVTGVDEKSAAARSDALVRARILPAVQKGRTQVARREGLSVHVGRARGCWRAAQQLARLVGVQASTHEEAPDESVLKASAAAFPDRICFERSENWAVSGGESVVLGYESLVREAHTIAALQIFGSTYKGDGIVRLASEVELAWLDELFPESVVEQEIMVFDPSIEKVQARRQKIFRELVIEESVISTQQVADERALAEALAHAARDDIERAFGLGKDELQFLERVRFLRREMGDEIDLFDPDFEEDFETLIHLVWGKRSFQELRRTPFIDNLLAYASPRIRQQIDELAPAYVEVPTGSRIRVDYSGDQPVLAVRIQEIFGWTQTPAVAGGRAKILLHLLAPNYRPAQVTQDLASFWANTYPEVRKELRARYPKHSWPEDPLNARPERK